jgi:hypothetical protein
MRVTMRTQPPVSVSLPSLASLEENDDRRLSAELILARLKAHLAAIRTLADQIEPPAQVAEVAELLEHVVEDVARLGFRLFEVASSRRVSFPPESSGVFLRVDASLPTDSPDPAAS